MWPTPLSSMNTVTPNTETELTQMDRIYADMLNLAE